MDILDGGPLFALGAAVVVYRLLCSKARLLATDDELAAACECPREVYVEGELGLRKAFAPATIEKWTQQTYADGVTKYNAGRLQIGDQAPDVPLYQRKSQDVRQVQLRSLLQAGRYLCLDFGSFS